MAEYKGIKGAKVRNYTTDPDNPFTGQVWYNNTTGALRVQSVTTSSAWATANPINTARNAAAGAGTQTAALLFTGSVPGPSVVNESYNGTTWTELNDLNTARVNAKGAGASNTSALCTSGDPATVDTETWNGTSWTEVNNLNSGGGRGSSAGVQTAALYFRTGANESWNGTSWTEVNDLNNPRSEAGGSGLQTAALAYGSPSTTESWNGTSWTNLPATINSARQDSGSAGLQADNAIYYGTQASGITEFYNGSAWTEVNDMNTSRRNAGYNMGTGTAATAAGGYDGTFLNNSEEFSFTTTPQAQTITTD